MPDRANGTAGRPESVGARWQLQDAKARFSELVRRARAEGPQVVTIRGKSAVVVLAAEEMERLRSMAGSRQSLLEFLQSLELGAVDVERDPDFGRHVKL